jgi:hypothetical protein
MDQNFIFSADFYSPGDSNAEINGSSATPVDMPLTTLLIHTPACALLRNIIYTP